MGTVPKVSAGTVHGSTEWCRRELSPETPTDKAAAKITIDSWYEIYPDSGNAER